MTLVFKKKSIKNIGGLIKSTEKEIEWVVQVNYKSFYKIQFIFSELTNQKVLKLNELTILKIKIPRNNLNHSFQIENIDFTIKYDQKDKAFKLLAYANDIEQFTEENLQKSQFAKPNHVNYNQHPPHVNVQQPHHYLNVAPSNAFAYQAAPLNAYAYQANVQPQPHISQQEMKKQPTQEKQQVMEQQLTNAENLVKMFDDVIDSCRANQDVSDSEALKELKKSIQAYQKTLPQCLNYEINEQTTDKVLKMLDKINQSIIYYDKICTREIIIDQQNLSGNKKTSNNHNGGNIVVPDENNQNNGKSVPLINCGDSDTNSDEDVSEQIPNHQYPQQINHQYPKQPESQILFYQKKQQSEYPQYQQSGQIPINRYQFPSAPAHPSSYPTQIIQPLQQQQEQQTQLQQQIPAEKNQILFPSLPPQKLKQYPGIKLNEQVSPQPSDSQNLKQSIKFNSSSSNNKSQAENECIICFNAESTHTLLPCGHKKYCGDCAKEMEKKKECALCKMPCTSSLRIYD